MRKKTLTKDSITAKGFFKLEITQDTPGGPRVVGGTKGFIKNQITNLGFQDYLCNLLAGTTGSKQVNRVALGTGGAPAASDTSLAGELTNHSAYARATPTVTVNSSKSLQFLATFSSSVVTANANISNIGLYNTSAAGTLFAGNTYASSTLASNQNVNVTYEIRFS